MAIKVLIVDDAVFMRNMIREVFTPDRFEVVAEAANGQEAIDRYKQHKPDLVTMDIVMPMMSGIDATRAIVEFDPNAKIIMCSALGQEALVMEALDAGASDFIVKPFQPDDVLKVVNKVLAR